MRVLYIILYLLENKKQWWNRWEIFLTPKLPAFHFNSAFHLHFMCAQIIPPWCYLVLIFLLIFIDFKYIRSLMVVLTLQQWIQSMEVIVRHGSPFPHILWGEAPLQFLSHPNEFASDANNPYAPRAS